MKNFFRIAIVEDEEKCIESLKDMLFNYGQEKNLQLDISAFQSVENFLVNYKCYDLVFMDIELPGMNGMDGARKLREIDSMVTLIFVTNIAQFAVQGYEVSALDYLLKPVTYKNLMLKLDRAIGIIEQRDDKRVYVSTKEGAYCMSVHEIIFVEVRGHHLIFHKMDGEIVDVCGSLGKLMEELRESGFARCNSCYLLNMKYITKIKAFTVTVSDGTELQISRRKRKAFMDELTAFMGKSVGEE